jgi:DNA-binding transcriptional LysR family regulator
MDLEDVRTFIKVAELASFSRASEQLGSSKSRVSLRVSSLEAVLGCRLLSRSTRAVRLTSDGELFLTRARRLVLEADELAALFQAPSTTRGRLRVDLPLRTAHDVVIPRLGEFLAAHPLLEVLVSSTDRRVDVVRDGFDCVLRVGSLVDSGLAVRRLGVMSMVNLVSPAYLTRYGTPRTSSDLGRHYVVHYAPTLGAGVPSFEYEDGGRYRLHPMRSLITVNNAIAYTAACVAGLGIIQAPRYGAKRELADGTLVEVLPSSPSPCPSPSCIRTGARFPNVCAPS